MIWYTHNSSDQLFLVLFRLNIGNLVNIYFRNDNNKHNIDDENITFVVGSK